MPLRFLQLSDLELGARCPFLGPAQSGRAQEIRKTVEFAIDHALDPAQRIDGLLIPGNLFHRHNPDPEIVEFWKGQCERLVAAHKLVIACPGIQDSALYKNSVYRTTDFPGVTLIPDTTPSNPWLTTIRGMEVAFYAMAPEPGQPEMHFPGWRLCPEAQIHIGLVNGTVLDHPEWSLRSHSLTVDPRVLEDNGLDYVALGGYHGHTVLPLKGTTAAYSGSLDGLDFVQGDLGPRTLLVVELDGRSVNFERVPLEAKVLELAKVNLKEHGIRDPEALLETIRAHGGERVMARIILEGPLEFLCDVDQLTARAATSFAWLEIDDRTEVTKSALLRRIEGENTIRGLFVRRMMKRLDEVQAKIESDAAPLPALEAEKATLTLALRQGLEPFVERDEIEIEVEVLKNPKTRRCLDESEDLQMEEASA